MGLEDGLSVWFEQNSLEISKWLALNISTPATPNLTSPPLGDGGGNIDRCIKFDMMYMILLENSSGSEENEHKGRTYKSKKLFKGGGVSSKSEPGHAGE